MGETIRRERAIVLVSGGLDSCVCLAEAVNEYDVAVLHLNYGQRTEKRELEAFTAVADHFGVKNRLVVDISYLHDIGGSSLMDASQSVETGLPDSDDVPSTYVPFRNANILSIAVSWGEVIGARVIFIGAVEEDGSGYPDCTAEFYKAFSAAVDAGTKPATKLEIRAPLLRMDKAAIVEYGQALGAPLAATWSCYVNEDEACGECESCRLRLRGFDGAGVEDPIPYRR